MKQEQALAILKSGRNVFLTGSAGAGKTFVLNQYIKFLRARKIPVAVTASTGIAATHMNGLTIHAWSGIGVKSSLSNADLSKLETKKYLTDQLHRVKVLIIDEISMLHLNQLDLVNDVLKYFKKNQDAFGGIQVIFSGDFFQLPPIGEETSSKKFAFMSKAWLEANLTVCYITDQYRQGENDLNTILNEIRTGSISEKSKFKLKDAEHNRLNVEWKPTKLYTHNVDVDRINQEHLSSIQGFVRPFKATTKGNSKLLEVMKKSIQASEHIELKTGAKVMFVKNNPELGYINGSLGEVVGYDGAGFPKIKLLNGRIIVAKQESWSIEGDKGKSLATFSQVPLRLAWAITIHKSQGMTLDAAEIDLSKTFEKGQGYVALSRLKSMENLRLLGFNETALEVDSLALKADKRFQELSALAESEYSNAFALEQESKSFIIDNGGIIDEEEIASHARKSIPKAAKVSTYDVTKELVEKGWDIAEIAKERGYSHGTILSHLIKLKEKHPNLPLEKFKPKEADLKRIQTAYNRLEKPNGLEPIKFTPLYGALKGEYSYDELKLASLFFK